MNQGANGSESQPRMLTQWRYSSRERTKPTTLAIFLNNHIFLALTTWGHSFLFFPFQSVHRHSVTINFQLYLRAALFWINSPRPHCPITDVRFSRFTTSSMYKYVQIVHLLPILGQVFWGECSIFYTYFGVSCLFVAILELPDTRSF